MCIEASHVFYELGVGQCLLCSLAAGKHSFGQTGSSPKHTTTIGKPRSLGRVCKCVACVRAPVKKLQICLCVFVTAFASAWSCWFECVCSCPPTLCRYPELFSCCLSCTQHCLHQSAKLQ